MMANFFSNLFGVDDEYNEQEEYYDQTTSTNATTNVRNSKVVPFDSSNRSSTSTPNSQIDLVEPRLYGDAREIATQLLDGKAVIVNFSQMDANTAVKVVDFLNGAIFAIDGEIKRIGEQIFLCTPRNFEVAGKLAATLKNMGQSEM
ncbi:cell division protein SepF [Limosilactobacillus gastricus]